MRVNPCLRLALLEQIQHFEVIQDFKATKRTWHRAECVSYVTIGFYIITASTYDKCFVYRSVPENFVDFKYNRSDLKLRC